MRPDAPPSPRLVNPSSLAEPHGYNNGVVLPAGGGADVLFVAGQIGTDRTGAIVDRDFTVQFEQALRNVLAVVHEAGGVAESIGKLTIFVCDKTAYVDRRRAVGEAYRRHMGKHFPAMTLVEVKSLLEAGALVEIEAVAVVNK